MDHAVFLAHRIVFAVALEGGGNGGTSGIEVQRRSEAVPSKVRLNLDVSQEISDFLDQLATENSTTKTDVMRRAIALLKVAHEEKKRNRSMGFVNSDRDEILETKIVGVL